MGPEFDLPVVMPALLKTASAKADISVYGMRYAIFSSEYLELTYE
jgi:hypothetical protein